MSPNGAPATREPEPSTPFTPVRMTVNEFQDIALFFKRFLKENPILTASIMAAGVGGLFETLHVVWLALRYIFRF